MNAFQDEGLSDLFDQFSALHDNCLSSAETATLEKKLLADQQSRRLYIRYSRMCAGLEWRVGRSFDVLADELYGGVDQAPARREPSHTRRKSPAVPRWAIASISTFAAVLVMVLVAAQLWRVPAKGPNTPTAAVVAHVGRTIDCVWSDDMQALQTGDALTAGQDLELTAGRVEVEFNGGAKVVLDGPASLRLRGSDDWKLQRGRMTVHLPGDHRGLVLETPAVRVTRCSADFAIEVDANQRTGLHVFDGQIEARRNGDEEAIQLTAGMTQDFLAAGSIARDDAADVKWIGLPEPLPSSPELEHWRELRTQLSERRDVLGYYTFEQVGDGNTLPNVAKYGVGGVGAVNRARWRPGRIPGKTALEFGDNRHVMLGMRYRKFTPPFTIAAWVCPSDVGRAQSVMASPPWFEPRGFAFGLNPTGAKFTVWRVAECQGEAALAPNRWMHLAASVSNEGRVALFLDGNSVGRMATTTPLVPAEEEFFIGSVGHRDFFHGLIDELLIFNRQLADPELEELYQAGTLESLK